MHPCNMKNLPKRTGGSVLSDDELIILDALAINGSCNINIIKKDNYPIHMNCSYSHDILDEHIENKMAELASKGWINLKIGDVIDIDFDCQEEKYKSSIKKGPIYSITSDGGMLWEIERTPIWDSYCMDSSYSDENDDNIFYLEINCLSEEIGLKFAKCLLDCGLYEYKFDKLKTTTPDPDFVPWKKFNNKFAWKVQLKESGDPDTDWDCYEKTRIWWRGIGELQKLIA